MSYISCVKYDNISPYSLHNLVAQVLPSSVTVTVSGSGSLILQQRGVTVTVSVSGALILQQRGVTVTVSVSGSLILQQRDVFYSTQEMQNLRTFTQCWWVNQSVTWARVKGTFQRGWATQTVSCPTKLDGCAFQTGSFCYSTHIFFCAALPWLVAVMTV
jgi:hypothetical protein